MDNGSSILKWGLFNLIILLICKSTFLFAQENVTLPLLKAANVTAFDIDEGLPISCAFNGLLDTEGRLWINPCFAQTEHQTVPFYQYDGVTSQLVKWDSLPNGFDGQAAFSGLLQSGWIYGFFRKTDRFFLFNPDTHNTRFYSLDKPGAEILHVGHSDRQQLTIYAVSEMEHLLYRLNGDSARLLYSLPMIQGEPEVYRKSAYLRLNQTYQTQLVHGDDFWFLRPVFLTRTGEERWYSVSFERINMRTGERRTYTLEELTGKDQVLVENGDLPRYNISRDMKGNVLFFLIPLKLIIRLDNKTGGLARESSETFPASSTL